LHGSVALRCAAQAGADAGDDLRRIERFADVVVGTEFQAGHAVLDLRAAGDDDDHGALLKREAVHDGQAVGVGQRQIDEADVGGAFGQCGLEGCGAAEALGLEPRFLQDVRQQGADFRLVVEDADEGFFKTRVPFGDRGGGRGRSR